jgi:hypothetical protein
MSKCKMKGIVTQYKERIQDLENKLAQKDLEMEEKINIAIIEIKHKLKLKEPDIRSELESKDLEIEQLQLLNAKLQGRLETYEKIQRNSYRQTTEQDFDSDDS